MQSATISTQSNNENSVEISAMTNKINALLSFALVFTLLLFSSRAMAADDPIYTPLLSNKAVSGYDVVSYFNGDQVPVKGKSEFSTEYKGAEWLFASQENLDTFLAEPMKYAPQYGGYCAYAVALGQTAKGDPLQYHINDGKLYLNINQDIRTKWLGNKQEYISKANDNWPNVLN